MFNSLPSIMNRTSQRLAVFLLAVFVIMPQMLQAATEHNQAQKIVAVEGPTMGTRYHVKWVAHESETRELADQQNNQVNQLLIDINKAMSTYIADSELSLFNKLPSGSEQQVSSALYELLVMAQQISKDSGGAYDVTLGPLINLWGFGPDRRSIKAPTQAQIDAVRHRVGYQHLELLADNRIRKNADLYIDLSSIAKGYAVDQVANLIASFGYSAYLVEIGGELITKGFKPKGAPWRIAVESPTQSPGIQSIVQVSDIAVATSGDYRIYFEEKGVRYSHIINTKTAKPISHNLASVTVLAAKCALADALATTFLAMGLKKAYSYALKNGVDAFFISKGDSGFVETLTPGFGRRIIQ